MKQLQVILSLFLVLGVTSQVSALPVWFDADGAGTDHTAVLIDELSGEATSNYPVVVALGDDGELGNGDAFTESFDLALTEGNLTGTTVSLYNQVVVPPIMPTLWAEIDSLEGTVENYTSASAAPTTASDPLAILDDTFTTEFTPFAGVVNFYFDATPGDAAGELLLGTFELTYGSSDSFTPTGNDTLTSKFGLSLVATYVAEDVWFMDNGGTQGTDYADIVSPASDTLFFLALADSSVNLINFAGIDNEGLTDDFLVTLVDDNGTDVEFEVVPEPSTLILLGGGLLGLGFSIHRKKNRQA